MKLFDQLTTLPVLEAAWDAVRQAGKACFGQGGKPVARAEASPG